MRVVPQVKQSRAKDAILAATSSEQTSSLPKPDARQDLMTMRSQSLDQFKFRIVEQGGVHYFQDVRFKAPHINDGDEKTIVEFFEGRSLEGLSSEILNAFLGTVAVLPLLQDLVDELQRILCD